MPRTSRNCLKPATHGKDLNFNRRLPAWFRQKIPCAGRLKRIKDLLGAYELTTVCEQARCPNLGECWQAGNATFQILGKVCTRECGFCAVEHGVPKAVDALEPEHVSAAVRELGLRYVVITSVTRDDLADGGAGHFFNTVSCLRRTSPETAIELLIPDFQGREQSLNTVMDYGPDVIGHNMETVRRLSRKIRPQADYDRSLSVLRTLKRGAGNILVKSGFMAGLGEDERDIEELFQDLRRAGCDMVTVGQYLAPSKTQRHVPVARYVTPEQFAQYRDLGLSMGFLEVISGPLVRSSFLAEKGFRRCREVLRKESTE